METETSSSASLPSSSTRPPPDIYFLRSSLITRTNSSFGKILQSHGFAILLLDTLTDVERDCLLNWERIFSEVFQLSQEEKDQISKFDAIQGQTMGYRQEGLREFIETRLQGNDTVLPRINHEKFDECVKTIWKILREITVDVISCMARYVGIDPLYFLELIDQDLIPEGEISSTVLRICSYPFDINHTHDSQISFGAHTDTSFVTLGCFSSTSGLEIQDNLTNSWISVEEMITRDNLEHPTSIPTAPHVAVFVGDVMQLLTNGFYKATIHRVRTYHRHPLKDLMSPRVSCPFLVRGRHKSKIRSTQLFERYPAPLLIETSGERDEQIHPPISTSSLPLPTPPPIPIPIAIPTSTTLEPQPIIELPDFEDLNMRLIHTLLDRKRQKCMKQNQDTDETAEWVLKAF